MRWSSSAAGWAVVVSMIAAAVAVRAADEGDARRPVPPVKDQEEALATIRSLFQKDFATAKTAPQQAAVAQKILEAARTSGDDNVGRYTLYRVARDIYARSNDLDPLLALTAEVEEQFADDGGRFRLDGLAGLVRGTTLPSKKTQLALQLETAIEQAVVAEKFAQAREALTHAQNLARTASDKDLPRRLAEREKALDKQQELFAQADAAISKGDPNDQAGLLAAGKYLTFVKRDYERGLELLSKSNDPALASQAKSDAASPQEPTQLAAVADGWWQLADKYPELAGGMKGRAIELYRTAHPGLTGLLKTKVEQRLATAVDAGARKQGSWLVVFRSADPKHWNTDYKGDEGMAKALTNLPKVKYLKMSLPGKMPAMAVIIPITAERLVQRSMVENIGWEGSKYTNFGAIHLGIYAENLFSDRRGMASIAHKSPPLDYSGWGFGHIHSAGDPVSCWAGKALPAGTKFEIAISPGPLTKEEEKLLLK